MSAHAEQSVKKLTSLTRVLLDWIWTSAPKVSHLSLAHPLWPAKHGNSMKLLVAAIEHELEWAEYNPSSDGTGNSPASPTDDAYRRGYSDRDRDRGYHPPSERDVPSQGSV